MHSATLARPAPSGPTAAEAPLVIRFEGALFAHHSLAVVNRELASRLCERGHAIEVARTQPDAFVPEAGLHARLCGALAREGARVPDVTIRHHWPPDFERPAQGRLVVVQPWEYGALPRAWIEPIERHVDEVWVPSNWVRETYLAAGIAPERVHVVPNGVDTRRFTPRAPKREFPTRKSLKFLFVGGALPRKGVHVLLEAWKRAFTCDDDVTLIVKDFGARDVYRGQTLCDLVREHAARPRGAEIVYLDDTLEDRDMPGLFTGADVLVHPFLAEGFGLPIAEAMACGLPVVVTGGGPALDFCDDVTGYLVPARRVNLGEARVGDLETVGLPIVFEPDVDALATILRAIADDPARARAKGRLAREKIRAGFTWEHAADRALARLRAQVAVRPSRPARALEPSRPAPGTNVLGDVPVVFGAAPFNWSGYARITRMLLPALAGRGVTAALQPYASDRSFLERQSPGFLCTWRELLARRPRSSVHVAFHPPVAWDGYGFFSNARAQNPGAIAHVGFTMFETDRIPTAWVDELARMDEVFVPCSFNAETFAAAGVPREKLNVFRPGLDLSGFTADVKPYPLRGEPAFTFLSVFQWTRRKGWDVLLESFVRAFRRDDPVRLVIRAYPGERKDPPLSERIAAHLASLGVSREDAPRIELVEEFVAEQDLPSLYAAADAYVLPTRGEGFGLPFLEAMAAGLPTIGTNWSGHLDFLDDDVGYLIDVDGLEAVHPEQTEENPYYEADHRWARPSVAHTSALMRRVFERRDEARAKGRAARERVFAEWSAERGAERFAVLVRDVYARAQKRPRISTRFAELPPVLWSGPLLDLSGYADEGRDLVLGLDAIGLRVRTIPLAWGEPIALTTREAEVLKRTSGVTLLEPAVAVQHGFGGSMVPVPSALANVGRTMFETDRAPASWVEPLARLDEVWVPSRWQLEGFARSGIPREKLAVVHGTLDAGRFDRLPAPLEVEGARGFNFLSIFDWSRRKGWDVLVRAFVQSFEARDDVALLLKVHSSQGESLESLQRQLADFVRRELGRDPAEIPTIRLLGARLSRDELVRLYARCQAYVSPSRGEGWGRPLLEAMAAGLPTIGTRFGGNTEFMDDATSFLLDARIVDVPPEAVREQPLYAGHRWAEPDVGQLSECLVRVVRDRPLARARAIRARESVLERFDRRIVAQAIAARVRELAAKKGAR